MQLTTQQHRRIHLVGIGGIGMSGVARLLLERGFEVSGSDLQPSSLCDSLVALGAQIYQGHCQEHVNGADLVVVSSAIPEDNPELVEARGRLPVLHRAEMLASLAGNHKMIAITGTHGKSTTTAMVGDIIAAAGWDPAVVIGAEAASLGGNVRLGDGEWFVVEADESDGSFIHFDPSYALVTNIEREHVEHFPTLNELLDVFGQFISRVRDGSPVVIGADCAGCQELMRQSSAGFITFGMKSADYIAQEVMHQGWASKFEVWHGTERLGRVRLPVPGVHNVLNALGAVALCDQLGISFDIIADALCCYGGLKRRMECVGDSGDVLFIDDYAHHPAEVRAVVASVREALGRRVVAVFQPHRYSRTQALADEFGAAFKNADAVCITDIYPASEEPMPGVSGQLIADAIQRYEPDKSSAFVPSLADSAAWVGARLRGGEVVLTLGAGDVGQIVDLVKLYRGCSGPSIVNETAV